LAEEWRERLRRGSHLGADEFFQPPSPARADAIRDLLPAIVMIEELKTGGRLPYRRLHAGAADRLRARRLHGLAIFRILREVGPRAGLGCLTSRSESLDGAWPLILPSYGPCPYRGPALVRS